MNDNIARIEDAKISKHHIKIMLISGISFFTDAYDLFIIGVILILIKNVFSTNIFSLGMLASAALFGAVLGPSLFGYFGDKFGRKRVYWITVSLLAIAAIGSSLAFGIIDLIIWRFVLGIAIGGDYPLSSTIVAEYSNKSNRGALIASTFAMQGFGIIVGIILAVALIYGGIPYALAWRILLAFGAIPALLTIPFRKKLDETPWYKEMLKSNVNNDKKHEKFMKVATKRKNILLGTTLSWFLIDVTYYGTGIFTPYLTTILGVSGVLSSIETTAILLLLFAVPGYWVAVALIDKQGRKSMQVIGFLAVALCFLIIAVFGSAMLSVLPMLFFAIYGLSFFFTNYGPNTTTYVYPVELYPTEFRSRGHGIAATIGKFGAAISVLIFPFLLEEVGSFSLLAILGAVALFGAIESLILLPETKQKSLEATSREFELHLINDTLSKDLRALLEHAKNTTKIIKDSFSEDNINYKILFENVKSEEHKADLIVRKIFDSITSTNINPTIYGDISHLAKRLDDIVDIEELIVSRILIYNIKKPDKYMKEFSTLIEQCVNQIDKGLNVLNRIEMQNNIKNIESVHIEVSEFENEADILLRISLEHASKMDAKSMIEYKEIYEWFESATDKAVDVVDIIEDIGLKYIYANI
ncbi:MAG: MFS transporter [Candidatus Marsarchaeota archaeon]|nr:MFS transporter [Candidatus Marsarchaeota archaeon]